MSSSSTTQAHHVLPLRIYLGVGTTLLVLTALTIIISRIDFGPWNMVVAIMIAAIKATLVGFFFMHLYYDNKFYFVIFMSAVLFLATFIIFTMFDTMERGTIDPMKAGPINPRAAMYEKMPVTTGHQPGESLTTDTGKALVPADTTADHSTRK